jgi:hypothetical protein
LTFISIASEEGKNVTTKGDTSDEEPSMKKLLSLGAVTSTVPT